MVFGVWVGEREVIEERGCEENKTRGEKRIV